MLSGYTVWAYSPSLHEKHRMFDLARINEALTDQAQAQQMADGLAAQYNTNRKGHATDWQGVIEWQDMGVETLPNYLFHKGG